MISLVSELISPSPTEEKYNVPLKSATSDMLLKCPSKYKDQEIQMRKKQS